MHNRFRLTWLPRQDKLDVSLWHRFGFVLATAAIFNASIARVDAQTSKTGSDEIPRFASIKADPANLRTGPGRQYPKSAIFRRAGLPVEIIQIYGTWRRIRDAEGESGWVSQYLLSRRRTALVLPWDANNKNKTPIYVDLRSSTEPEAQIIARLQAGTLVSIKSCDGKWCYVAINRFAGYLTQKSLWGVYPSEKIG